MENLIDSCRVKQVIENFQVETKICIPFSYLAVPHARPYGLIALPSTDKTKIAYTC